MAPQKLDKSTVKMFLAGVTHQPGVYQMFDAAGTLLYVGKARDLKKRLASYFSSREKDIKTARLMQHVADITMTVTHDENAALLLECNLIKRFRPHYNVLFRDDKSYPFILLSAHAFPRIMLWRGRKKKPGGRMFGPFADTSAVRDTINLIEKIFQLRNCSDSFYAARKRPCIQYQIRRCTAPCTGLISGEGYQRQVQAASLFLQGKDTEVIAGLQLGMEAAAEQLDFERAAFCRDQISCLRDIQSRQYVSGSAINADVLGYAAGHGGVCIQVLVIRNGRMLGSRAFFPDEPVMAERSEFISAFIVQRYLDPEFPPEDIPGLIVTGMALPEEKGLISALEMRAGRTVTFSRGGRARRKKWLEMAETSALQSIASRMSSKNNMEMRLSALAKCLDLPAPPSRVECMDISHTMGEATVGSSVVWGLDGPLKNFYRRFNITGITPGDDMAAMRQLLQRRFAGMHVGDEARLPDVLLIDGGLPQMKAVSSTLQELGLGSILTVGIAKGATRKAGYETLHLPGKKSFHLPPDSPALHLIQQIRDEAHRFAITAHRARRDRKRKQSVLETIPGIGSRRRRMLLTHFGGLQAINRASLEELLKVPGISRALAERIYEALHRST